MWKNIATIRKKLFEEALKMIKKKKPIIIHQNKIRYVCKECGHIEKNKFIDRIATTIILIVAVLGAISIITFIMLATKYDFIILGKSFIETTRYYTAHEPNEEIRELTIPSIKHCEGDEDCVIITIANKLHNETTYAHSGFRKAHDPDTTLRTGVGNCEELSMLAVNTLKQFNIKAYIDCIPEHCVAIAKPRRKDYYYLIDLTRSYSHIERWGEGGKHWELYKVKEEK